MKPCACPTCGRPMPDDAVHTFGLTEHEERFLSLLEEHFRGSRVAPSYDELKDAMGIKSKSGVHHLVRALEARGYIRRLPRRPRAIALLRRKEEA